MSQTALFLDSEGDNYFARNREANAHFDPRADPPLQLLDLYGVRAGPVLEIGASNGFRLAEIARRYGGRVVAVEPSLAAIQDGQQRYPQVEFHRGVIQDTTLTEQFGVVIVHYVFHWVDRTALLRAAAEVDERVRNGGFLLVGDFYPSLPLAVPYHHRPNEGIFTYKQEYLELFLASKLYRLVGMLEVDHRTHCVSADAPPAERGGVWLLKKDVDECYVRAAAR